jgi:homoserine kinase type II
MTPFADLLSNWGLIFSHLRPDLAIPGSPERCLVRHVVEDTSGSLWMLEQLGPGQSARREALGKLLDELAGRGLHGLAPYRRAHVNSGTGASFRASAGAFILKDWGRCWQLSPFVLGDPLIQPDYLDDSSRGDSLGAWMADFRKASTGLPVPDGLFSLDLPAYVTDLLARIARARPDVHTRASRVLPALSEFFEAYAELPRSLCHGDVHPLNVVWGGSGLLAVIDWEFAGLRPEIYDLANCLGCTSIEGDGGFDSPFAQSLLSCAQAEGLLPDEQARWLSSMILATRFGWLSEWLRRKDEEMIELELAYMEHLAAHP